jgi:hypothetical protein
MAFSSTLTDKTHDNRYKRTRKCYATNSVHRADMKLFRATVSYKFRYRSNCDLLGKREFRLARREDQLCLIYTRRSQQALMMSVQTLGSQVRIPVRG